MAEARKHPVVTAPPPIDDDLRATMAAGAIPGFVAAAIGEGGPLYESAAGRRCAPDGPAMTPDAVFWIASLTKPVTSAAAMQLVERGRLHLDRPAADILPELRSPMVLTGFDDSGAPILRPAKSPITLRHLLTHTAGVTYDSWNENTARYVRQTGMPSLFTCTDASLRTPLAFDPGERWQYGAATDWVGKLVEAVSGERLEEYFREHIFAPLGMSDTSFRLTAAQRSRLSAMHQRAQDGSVAAIDFEVPQDPEFYMGGGGLYSTASDYLKFLRLFLREGSDRSARILSPGSIAAMSANQIGGLAVVPLRSTDPDGYDVDFLPGTSKKWGFGFLINTEDTPTGRSAGSLAWAGAANEYFWVDPTRHVAGVMLMQYFPFCDPAALKAFERFETGVYRLLS